MRHLLLAVVVLLAGCDSYYVGEYRERFPVVVQRQSPVLLVAFAPGSAELAAMEVARLDAFLGEYVTRNSGPLRVTVASVGTDDRMALARVAAVEARALAVGVPKSLIELKTADRRSTGADATLIFDRYVAQVPECGDWTKSTTSDWTNTPSSNFGCATQRNIGLMAADPQDLLKSPVPGSHDPTKLADTLAKYRTGAGTVATKQEPTAWKDYFNITTGAPGQ